MRLTTPCAVVCVCDGVARILRPPAPLLLGRRHAAALVWVVRELVGSDRLPTWRRSYARAGLEAAAAAEPEPHLLALLVPVVGGHDACPALGGARPPLASADRAAVAPV